MNEAPLERLTRGLDRLGYAHTSKLAASLLTFGEWLLAANKRTNLVGARTLDDLITRHLLDSLAPLRAVRLADPIVDVGSGGGLPGIPAALAWPKRRFVLLEPRAKRAEFLRRSVEKLGLRNVQVIQRTAGAACAESWRGKAGTVLVRALAKPGEAIRVSLPLLRRGGLMVLYQGRAASPGQAERGALRRSNGLLREATKVEVPYLAATRHVWLIEKL